MQKNLIIQKLFYYVFLLTEMAVFVYALAFMTDFSQLFGLRLEMNAPIADFHNIQMQEFNRAILVAAVLGILLFVVSLFLEINKLVPDKFAVVIMSIALLGVVAFSIFSVLNLQNLSALYQTLDFLSVTKEGGSEHIVQLRTFEIGAIIFAIQGAIAVLYSLCLISNHCKYMKHKGGVKL